VPNSVLVIKDKVALDAVAQARIGGFLADEGIDRTRLRFLGHETNAMQHLLAYNTIDIALDTTPWSSATTGFDALGMGVPLVAIRGDATISRMSSSLVRALGRPGWEAHDVDSFTAIVATLASSHHALRGTKASLQQEVLASPLYNGKDLAQHLDHAFAAMIQKKAPKP
jgi:predicted O-linked N-acetylglucosamine transferase (SPINDLY family)